MGENTKEHSLFLQLSNERVSIATGCSHPSPTQFLNSVRSLSKIHGILGGLHGFKELEILEHLELIIPLHCTQKQSEILSKFSSVSYLIKVGESLQIPH